MPSIAVVIITKNEEKNIGRCLASVKSIADEIIVVDSQSTDNTATICQQHGVQFVTRPWAGYSATKNFANSLATSDYILSLDADEALSPELLAQLVKEKNTLRGVYEFSRLMSYCGHWIRHGGWYPDKKIRLFPRTKARWNNSAVHEDLEFDRELTCAQLSGDILHYSYYNIAEHISRLNLYTDLSAAKLAQKSSTTLLFKALLNPVIRFVRNYVLRGGFLDGKYGLIIAVITSIEVFIKYAKALQIKTQNDA